MPADSLPGGLTLADRMRRHAGDRTHLYGELMRAMASDWEQGGPVRTICRGWETAPEGTVVQLRLLGGLFRIVLSGRAPQLEPFYPCLGGAAGPADSWTVARPVLAQHVEELHAALEVAPQTNEVGRSNALLTGLLAIVRRTGVSQVRLLEAGASGGLNLLLDRYRFVNAGWTLGPADSPVQLVDGIVGPVEPRPFTVVERRGCDLSPVDVSTEEGRMRLRSFVWPFQVERHERLAAALHVAQVDPPIIDRAGAASWVTEQLGDPRPGAVTVLWQSVTRQYWPEPERRAVDAALRDAGRSAVVAAVSMETLTFAAPDPMVLEIGWSDGTGEWHDERLGTVADHGVPVILDSSR